MNKIEKYLVNIVVKNLLDSKLLTLKTEKCFKIAWFMTLIRYALIMIEEAIDTVLLNEQNFEPTLHDLSLHPPIRASFNPHLRRLYLSKMVISTITNGQGGENKKQQNIHSKMDDLSSTTPPLANPRLLQKGGKNVRTKCNRWLQSSF